MQLPLISIIVPVYNAEKYLSRCLTSLAEQDYKNLEFILVDDGSTDNSVSMCDSWSRNDKRFRVIHQSNQGAGSARNTGMREAKGQWIGFADSDDWMEADMYGYLLDMALETNADIVQCGLFFDFESNSMKGYTVPEVRVAHGGICAFMEEWNILSNQIYNKLYRRDVARNIQFRREYPIGEDLVFNIEALKQAGCVTFCTEAKYHYVQYPESLCHKRPTAETLFSLRKAIFFVMELVRENDTAYLSFQRAQLRNDLDICYKIAAYDLSEMKNELRTVKYEIRQSKRRWLYTSYYTFKEKVKFELICRLWPIYRFLVSAF